ncbi:prenyltransferase/squalene oxidase repeat-containing protein [Aeoliella sp.]|uniref:prenyltransferase/squalene oxidase repeat-containing protein n=1 Tax=Aeoliella sp. TaxID=2795800 RepID=UPI003CCB9A2B
MHSLLDQLQSLTPGGYTTGGPPVAEPVAWAALAIDRSGYDDAADRAAQWLVERQLRDGSVPASSTQDGPFWTTSLAILAWHEVDAARYEHQIQRAAEWLLSSEGRTMPRNPNMGHDTTLVGWSWNPETHSWLEPTAFAVMALRAAGHKDHPRTREAVRLLVDRLLPEGGCNYGNTEVLGQMLLPHLQPSGVVLWSLATEDIDDPRVDKSLDTIEQMLEKPTGCSSLAFALLALSAWKRTPKYADELIAEALERPSTWQSPYKLALLTLASLESNSPRQSEVLSVTS